MSRLIIKIACIHVLLLLVPAAIIDHLADREDFSLAWRLRHYWREWRAIWALNR